MPEPLSERYLSDLSDEVALTLLVAMKHEGVESVRELSRLTGLTHTYLNARLSKKDGRRTPVDVADLALICEVLRLNPVDVLRAAKHYADFNDSQRNGGYVRVGDPTFEMRYFGRLAQADFIVQGPDGLMAIDVKVSRGGDELAKRRRQVLSELRPNVTEEDLIGEPSVAEPERTDHEGDEDPGDA